MTHIKTIAGLCWIVLGGWAYAQQPERAISTVPNLDYAYSNLPTQPVGPDDLLALSVYDSPELTRTVRVDANGNIRLPMLKDPIQVAGMVPSQLEAAIAKSLTKGKVLVDPTARCLPPGMPRTMTTPFPIEFSVEPKRVLMLFEIGGVTEEAARICFRRLAHKMPVRVRFVRRRAS